MVYYWRGMVENNRLLVRKNSISAAKLIILYLLLFLNANAAELNFENKSDGVPTTVAVQRPTSSSEENLQRSQAISVSLGNLNVLCDDLLLNILSFGGTKKSLLLCKHLARLACDPRANPPRLKFFEDPSEQFLNSPYKSSCVMLVCPIGNLAALVSRHGGIRELTLPETLNLAQDLSVVAGLRYLQSLNLQSCGASNEDMKVVATVPTLTHLNLSCNKVTDAGVQLLEALPSLTSLDLSGLPATGKAVGLLAGKLKFKVLILNFIQTQNEDLKLIVACKTLCDLRLFRSGITDKDVETLAKSRLRSLTLSDNDITNVNPLAQIRWLRVLILESTKVDDEGLKLLVNARMLDTLDVSFTKITNAAVSTLAAIPRLHTLDMSGTSVTNINPLANARSLMVLKIADTSIPDEGSNLLAKKPFPTIVRKR